MAQTCATVYSAGLVLTLNGLNISNNPLEFPPQEVIDRGSQTILAFFRELLRAKSLGHIPNSEWTFCVACLAAL